MSNKQLSTKSERSDDDDSSDSKRNMRPKGREFKTPVYNDTDLPKNRDGLVDGFFLEYKSSSSKSSSSSSNKISDFGGITTSNNDTTTEDMIAEQTVLNLRRRYNTTSTVHAAHTITNPHCEQILFCMSSVIQAQICEDASSARNAIINPETRVAGSTNGHFFDFIPDLAAEFGGPVDTSSGYILDQEAAEDELLREEILNGFVPTIDTIYRYISLIYRGAGYSPECNIIALVFINRITTTHGILLTMQNWRALWLVAVILAQKVWDDKPRRTSAFTAILPSFPRKTLRDMESKALELLDYLTSVKPSLYAKYYFELRQLFTEIMGFQQSEWNLKPLSAVAAKKLEHKIQYSREYFGQGGGGGSSSSHTSASSSGRKGSSTVGSNSGGHVSSADSNYSTEELAAVIVTTASATGTKVSSSATAAGVAMEVSSVSPDNLEMKIDQSLSWSDEEEEEEEKEVEVVPIKNTAAAPSAVGAAGTAAAGNRMTVPQAPWSTSIVHSAVPFSKPGSESASVFKRSKDASARVPAAVLKADLEKALASKNRNYTNTGASVVSACTGSSSSISISSSSILSTEDNMVSSLPSDENGRRVLGKKFGTTGESTTLGENGLYVIS